MVVITKSLAEAVTSSTATYQIHPVWTVNGRVPKSDFTEPVEDMIRDYLKLKWVENDPQISTAPPGDLHNKVRFGDHDYDGFSTYYIKVKEGTTTFNNDHVGNGLFTFYTPVIIELVARRLAKGQQFEQLNNMRNEVIRIIAEYKQDDISGIPSMDLDSPGEIDNPTATFMGQKSVWYCRVTAVVCYFKGYS